MYTTHHILSKQRLAHSMHIWGAGTRHTKVLGEDRRADEVHARQEWLIILSKPGHDRLAKPRRKPKPWNYDRRVDIKVP